MIASPDLAHESPHHATPADTISPRQRWAHLLVLDMLRANLPLDRLAAHLNIPFLTLIDYINTPEVQAEIDAYDQLLTIRARLLGQTARPISLRKLLDVLESPAPQPTGRDPDADQRALHRHAELIRRTATTIARESRAFAPKPKRGPSASEGVGVVNSRATTTDPSPASPINDDAGSTANVTERTTAPNHTREPRVACLGADQACADDADNPPTGRTIDPEESPTDAEDARHCASPEPVDARRPHPTGSTDPANAAADAAHTAQPAPAPSEPPPSDPSPPSSSRSDASPPLRDSDSSAPPTQAGLRPAFSSPVRRLLRVSGSIRARDRPAA